MRLLFRVLCLLLLPTALYARWAGSPSADTVYRSGLLTITRLAPNTYVHTSYLNSPTFGRVACNGMIAARDGEAVVFDTPVDDSGAAELIQWISSGLQSRIKAVVSTHFHEDCVGGLTEFHRHRIPSFGTHPTIALAGKRGFPVPGNGFADSATFTLGPVYVQARFFGPGHTADNIVGYFPLDGVLFGGCLVKSLGADTGNLADADVRAWPRTVEAVKRAFPEVRFVIPGHGAAGDQTLLEYTIRLFTQKL